jgi:uncharacterized protein (DUF924 family)
VGQGAEQHHEKEWQAPTVDAYMARMILCDQIARNAFRATAYEKPALEAARHLAHLALLKPSPPPPPQQPPTNTTTTTTTLQGKSFPPYTSFIVTALMHSESLNNHDFAMQLLKQAQLEASSSPATNGVAQNQISFELEHKQVLE